MDMDPSYEVVRQERRQSSYRDQPRASSTGSYSAGRRRPSHSGDRRGHPEGPSSRGSHSSFSMQQPWRRGSSSATMVSTPVPRPVVLPSLRSEGHPSPTLTATGDDLTAETDMDRGRPAAGPGTTTNVRSNPHVLGLDAAARQELERRIEEQLRASAIDVAWADVDDEDDFDPTIDPFAENQQRPMSSQDRETRDEPGKTALEEEEDQKGTRTAKKETSRDLDVLDGPDNNKTETETTKNRRSRESVNRPLSRRPSSPTMAGRTRGDEPRRHQHDGKEKVATTRSLGQSPASDTMIIRHIPVKLSADAEEEVIPVRLPLRD